jgi:hypothetical protein
MHDVLRRTLMLVPLLSLGCSSMKPVALGPEPRSLASSSWIVVKSGERLELRDGRVTRDSLIGIRARARRAIPRDSVVSVEQRVNPSPVPFVMLGGLLVGAAYLVLTADLGPMVADR